MRWLEGDPVNTQFAVPLGRSSGEPTEEPEGRPGGSGDLKTARAVSPSFLLVHDPSGLLSELLKAFAPKARTLGGGV